ncbi:unnamed protein product [Staurois parvus]|uniref:Uncharacterized protein n=1 Tax=Staurois parvus TaxID=386267 RepID=A0ABN9CET0_9NEOB|nr:unnamed protein product [Staurois parvus]
MYTDHQSTDEQCALMISVAPVVPPVSVHQCSSVPREVPISATSMPHISAFQCISIPHISAHLSCLFSVTHQCQSVPHLSMPISATYQ